MTKSEYQRRWQQKQRAKGLCTSCSKPAVEGRSKCERHRVVSTNYRASRLVKSYGITERDYEAMLIDQGGVCKICRQPERFKSSGPGVKHLAVDHDHETGKVRGLLCNNCNRAIGLLSDSVDLVRRAADYLNGLVN